MKIGIFVHVLGVGVPTIHTQIIYLPEMAAPMRPQGETDVISTRLRVVSGQSLSDCPHLIATYGGQPLLTVLVCCRFCKTTLLSRIDKIDKIDRI